LVATGPEQLVAPAPSGEWVALPLAAPVSLAPATYWLGMLTGDTSKATVHFVGPAPTAKVFIWDAYVNGPASTPRPPAGRPRPVPGPARVWPRRAAAHDHHERRADHQQHQHDEHDHDHVDDLVDDDAGADDHDQHHHVDDDHHHVDDDQHDGAAG